MDAAVSEAINAKVVIDVSQGEITLPNLLQTYRCDFGKSDEEILNFIFKYLEGKQPLDLN